MGTALAIVAVFTVAPADQATAESGAAGDARSQLLERLERGATTTWGVTSRFHRETPAGPLDAELEQLNRRPDWLTAGFGSVHGAWQGRTIDCANAPGGKLCGPTAMIDPTVAARTSVKVVRSVTGPRGSARVRRDGTIRVDGRRGRCFSLLPRRGRTDTGAVYQYCLTSDGIPLRTRVRRPDSSDVATAEEIRREVTDADFERLLRGYPISPLP
jgi:hypothetical protein